MCDNSKCKCSDGFYQRSENICRRISMCNFTQYIFNNVDLMTYGFKNRLQLLVMDALCNKIARVMVWSVSI